MLFLADIASLPASHDIVPLSPADAVRMTMEARQDEIAATLALPDATGNKTTKNNGQRQALPYRDIRKRRHQKCQRYVPVKREEGQIEA